MSAEDDFWRRAGVWRVSRRMNQEIVTLYEELSFQKAGRIRWSGQVTGILDSKPAKQCVLKKSGWYQTTWSAADTLGLPRRECFGECRTLPRLEGNSSKAQYVA